MTRKEKIKELLIKNINLIFMIIFLIIFFMITFFDVRYKFNEASIAGGKYYIIFLVFAIIVSFIIIVLYKKTPEMTDKKIPKIFVITSIILGSFYIFLSPMFTGSDEHNHYYRIYEIASGTLVTPTEKHVGSKLPRSLKETFIIASGSNTVIKYGSLNEMLSIKLDKDDTIQYGNDFSDQYNNTALYSPIQYLPQVIGFSIGKFLNLSPYIIGILGRIFNLLFYTILGFFALKFVPKSKLFYLFILLSPNMLQCATTLSADAFTNAIFLLLIAIVFNKVYSKDKISNKQKIILFILSVVISLCKIVYVPIVFLLLLLDKNKFQNGKKEKNLFISMTILLSVFVSLFWMGYTDGVFAIAYDKTDIQKEFILSNIVEYAIIFIRTFANNFVKYIECLFVGTTMYHSQLAMPSFISVGYIAIVLLSIFKDKNKEDIEIWKKISICFISIIIIGLISTAIYIQCTAQFIAIANPTIGGIQGRYFIPIIMLVPYLLPSLKKKINVDSRILFSWTLTINVITFFYMIAQFSI